MRACIVSKDGCVYLHDLDTQQDTIALTASEAMWFASFMQTQLTSELIVQLRLAAQHANAAISDTTPVKKIFDLKRS